MKKTHEAITGNGSVFSQYLDVIVGKRSIFYFLYFEFCLLLSWIPGAAGMMLRKIFWPRLFSSCGKGVLFGANVVLRHPGRIAIGNRVVISDGCIFDARNPEEEIVIALGDNVMLSNNVMLSCKNGTIEVGTNTGINAQTIIQSTSNCPVIIGEDVIIGQRAFVIGGGNYHTEDLEIPIRLQGIQDDGGVHIQNNVWLGGNASVLGGVTLGHGSIVAASAVMTKSVEPFSICKGIPGKVHAYRNSAD
ncbi:acyltransferase [Desulfopila inferna]|uniref:acyltransferase n=1 Tax=Desulfopila inferna TaxID=468528 RepID=UPI0019646D69|nr:acyltransferase [Desulfopila inferna]MBM9602711.1 acyltransferase [Desulfopila inferna]